MTSKSGNLRELARSTTKHVLVGQVAARLVGFATTVTILKYLSVAEQGVYTWFAGTSLIFSLAITMGIAESLQRFTPEYHATGQWRRARETMYLSLAFVLVMSVVVFGIAYVLFPHVAGVFHMEAYRDIFVIFALSAAFWLQFVTLTPVLNGLFLHAYQSWGQVAFVVMKLVFIYTLFHAGWKVSAIFFAEMVSYFVVVCVLLVLTEKRMRLRARTDSSADARPEFGRVTRYALLNLAGSPGLVIADVSADFFVISCLLSDFQLGLYAFCLRVSRMFLQILPSKLAESVIRSTFYARYATAADKREVLNEMFNFLCRINLFFLVPTLVFVSLGARQIIPIIGRAEYLQAYLPFIFCFFFLVLSFYEIPADLVIQAVEKVKYRSVAQVGGGVLRVLGAVVAVKLGWGIFGVVWTSGLAMVAKNYFVYWYGRRHVGICFEWASFGRIAVNAVVGGIPMYLVLHFANNAAGLFVGGALCGLAYLAMTYVNQPFTPREQKEAMFFLKGRRG